MLGVLKAGQAITIISSSARLSQKEEKSLVNCWHRQSGTTLDTEWITPRNKAIPQSFDCSNTRRGWLPSEIDLTTATTNYIYCWEDLLDTAIKKVCITTQWRRRCQHGRRWLAQFTSAWLLKHYSKQYHPHAIINRDQHLHIIMRHIKFPVTASPVDDVILSAKLKALSIPLAWIASVDPQQSMFSKSLSQHSLNIYSEPFGARLTALKPLQNEVEI